MSVAEAQAKISAREFAEWVAYCGIAPFGPERDDVRIGILGAGLGNLWIGKGRKLKHTDFMPKFDAPRQQSQQEIWSKLRAFASVHNKAIGKDHGGSNSQSSG